MFVPPILMGGMKAAPKASMKAAMKTRKAHFTKDDWRAAPSFTKEMRAKLGLSKQQKAKQRWAPRRGSRVSVSPIQVEAH